MVAEPRKVEVWKSAIDKYLDASLVPLHCNHCVSKFVRQTQLEEAAEYELVPEFSWIGAQKFLKGPGVDIAFDKWNEREERCRQVFCGRQNTEAGVSEEYCQTDARNRVKE